MAYGFFMGPGFIGMLLPSAGQWFGSIRGA